MALTVTLNNDGTRTISGLEPGDLGIIVTALSPTMRSRMSSQENREDAAELYARLDNAPWKTPSEGVLFSPLTRS